MNKVLYSLKKFGRTVLNHIPEILTVTSLIAIPVGDYFIIKGTKEGSKKKQIIGIAFHCGAGVCIVLNEKINAQQKMLLGGVAAMKGTELLQYQKKVKEEIGEEKYNEIQQAVDEADYEKLMIEADEADELDPNECYDLRTYYFPQIRKVIMCDADSFNTAILNLNELYSNEWVATIADFFDFIDENIIKNDSSLKECCSDFGWEVYDEDPEAGLTRITVQQYTKAIRSGRDVTFVRFIEPPLRMDEWQDYYESLFRMAQEEEEKEYGRQVLH